LGSDTEEARGEGGGSEKKPGAGKERKISHAGKKAKPFLAAFSQTLFQKGVILRAPRRKRRGRRELGKGTQPKGHHHGE